MSTIQEIDDASVWDEQFEHDVAAGRLDALADEALTDLREGRCADVCLPVKEILRALHEAKRIELEG